MNESCLKKAIVGIISWTLAWALYITIVIIYDKSLGSKPPCIWRRIWYEIKHIN